MPASAILSIGDELILGRTCDTNATWLCARLADAGCPATTVRQVGDGEAGITAALASLAPGHQLILCTGGLGPTDDDRTRHALATLMGRPLEPRAAAWKAVLAWYAKMRPGMVVPDSNRRQALMPRGSTMLANDRGTAPGLLAKLPGDGPWIACLPGVPHEMKAMAERLIARLPDLVPGLRVPAVRELWLAGLGESAVQELIPGLLSEAEPMVGITVSDTGHMTIRAVGRPAQIARRLAPYRKPLQPWLLPAPGLAPSLIHLLTKKKQTIATAESCTVGQVAALLGGVPGASAVLTGGIVAYTPQAKQSMLGVDPDLIARDGVVSAACARAMAEGARQRLGVDVAIATTGFAGPGGGTTADPVGTVYLAVVHPRGVAQRRITGAGERQRVQQRAATAALQLAWEALTGRSC